MAAKDWVMMVDLPGEPVNFPVNIAVTLQRPDIVIFSVALKQILLIELTVPIEDQVLDAQKRKTNRYKALVQQCESSGWEVTLYTIEIGSRGHVGESLQRCLKQLGLSSSAVRECIESCSDTALRSSYMLYLRRDLPEWQDWQL